MKSDKQSIQKIFILPFVFVLIFVIAGGLLTYKLQEKNILEDTYKELSTVSVLKILQITKWRKDIFSDGNSISSNKPFIRQIAKFFDKNYTEIEKQEILTWMKNYIIENSYTSVILIDHTGKIRLSFPLNDTNPGFFAKNYLHKALNKNEIIFNDLHISKEVNFPHIDVLVPLAISEKKENQIIGVVLLRKDPQKFLFPLIRLWPTRSDSGETLLVKKDGNNVLFLNELRHRKNTALKLRLPIEDETLPAAMAVNGFEGMSKGLDYRGVNVIADIKKIPQSPWFLITKIDRSEVYEEIYKQAVFIAIIGSLLIFLSLLFFGYYTRNLNARFYKKQYEAELKNKALNKHFEYLVKYANDIIIMTDKKFNIVEFNDSVLKTYGYTFDEFSGMNLSNLDNGKPNLPPLESGKSNTYETIHRRKDSTTFPIEISSRFFDIDGETFYQIIARDITERKNSEERLIESEETLKLVLEGSNLGFWDWNLETNEVKRNPRWAEMLGYTFDEIKFTVMQWSDFVHPDDRERAWKSIKDNIEGKTAFHQCEYRMKMKDGNWKWIYDSAKVVKRDKQCKALRMSGTHNDITERKYYEEQLKQKDELIILAGQMAKVGGWEFDAKTLKGTWTPEVARIHDLDPENETNVELGISFYQEESKKKIENAIKEAIELEKPYDLELEIVTAKGVKKWVRTIGLPVTESGKVLKVRGVFQDITEQKLKEKQIQKASEKYRIITENMQDVVWILDPETMCFTYVSPSVQKLRGYTPEEIMELPFDYALMPEQKEVLKEKIRQEVKDIISRKISIDNYFRGEAPQPCKDGSVVWTEVVSKYYFNEDTRKYELHGVTRNITERKLNEEQLKQKDELIRLSGEIAKIGGWEFDAKTFEGMGTDEIGKIFELDPKLGHDVKYGLGLCYGESREKIEKAIKKLIEFGSPYDLEAEILTVKGIRKWVRAIGVAVKDGEQVVKARGIIQDITEFKNIEKQRNEEIQFISDFFRNLNVVDNLEDVLDFIGKKVKELIGDGMVIVSISDEERQNIRIGSIQGFEGFLPKALEILNFDPRDSVFPVSEMAEEDINSYRTGKLELLENGIYRLLMGKVPKVMCKLLEKALNISYVYTIGFMYQDKHMGGITLLLPTLDGIRKKGSIIETIIPQASAVIHRIHTQLILMESEKRYRSLFENMLEGFAYCRMYFDKKGIPQDFQYLAINKAFETLTGLGDVRGKMVSEVIPGIRKSDPLLFELYGKIAITGKSERFEIFIEALNDWYDVSVYSPKKEYFVAVFDIITQRKNTEKEIQLLNLELEKRVIQRTEELETSNKELESFSYSVSHDLRVPLRAIDGFTNILLEDYESVLDEEGKRLCGVIRTNTLRMARLIDDLLAFSRIGKSSLKHSQIDMENLVFEIFSQLTSFSDRERIRFAVQSLPPSMGDPVLIKQVWTNLISNAIKYSSQKEYSEILIGFEEGEKEITYFITDNGAGFDMEYKNKLFGVFQRLHSYEEFEGNGVGLAIVHNIINRHGGTVWAEAELNKGASFYFTLVK